MRILDPGLLKDPLKDKRDTADHVVKGPISADGGLDKTKVVPSTDKKPDEEPSENTELKNDGKNDKLDSQEQGEGTNETVGKEISGLRLWGWRDLREPLCRNCQAVINYEMVLVEYGNVASVKVTFVLVVMFLIWMLGTTAQDFFVPPLLYLSEQLRLPPELAGATLLALGNDAPDIFAVCMTAQKGDLPLSVSEMLGSNMFTLCVTSGVVALACSFPQEDHTHMKELDSDSLAEDQTEYSRLGAIVLVYVVGLVMLAVAMMHGTSNVWRVLCLPCVYLVYLIVLWAYPSKQGQETSLAEHVSDLGKNDDTEVACDPVAEELDASSLAGLSIPEDATNLDTAMCILRMPTYAVRWACIPPADGQWGPKRRYISSMSPVGILIFCLLTNVGNFQSTNIATFIGFTLLALLMSASIFIGSESGPALPKFYPALTLLALISAMLWLAVLATEITALVEAIGFSLKVPRMQLGFTAIAWGNSLSDLLVCASTARRGHANMAIAAIFAGPLIDDMIAFGAALGLASLSKGPVPAVCGEHCPAHLKVPLVTSLGFIMAAVLMLACMLRFKGLKSVQRGYWAAGLFAWYALFMVVVIFVMKVDAPLPPKDK